MTVVFVLAAAVAVLAAAGAYLLVSAARVVRPRSAAPLPLRWGDGRVALPGTPLTSAPGRYGIWADSDGTRGHLQVGAVLHGPAGRGRIHRELVGVTGLPARGAGTGVFTGQLYSSPEQLAPRRWSQTTVAAPTGACPAWLVPAPSGLSGVWAIHIHGFGTTRHTALRTVPIAEEQQMTSLILSFRGDGEGPPMPGGVSTLGATEWQDIDAAIDLAVQGGAQQVVLFAWSMGASAAFMAAAHGRHQDRISRIVAIAPVTDWHTVIRAGARRAHLPALLGSATAWALQRRPIQRALGLRTCLDLGQLAQAGHDVAEHLPVLLLHSELDPLVPYPGSARFAAAHPRLVQLEPFHTAGHAWEYNAEPQRFQDVIRRFLTADPAV